MALFGKLFDKKICDICGGEIGLLGNRKLEDGNMCKNCAKKLSPWFDDRRHSTIEQINEQLKYREENKARVATFCATRTFGDNKKIFIDDNAKTFMVTNADTPREWAEENPDVIDITSVARCELDISDSRREIKYRENNEDKSYNPPRYIYSYDFYLEIMVQNPYFDDIRVRLNRSSVEIESHAPQSGLFGFASKNINPEYSVEYRKYKMMGEEIKEVLLRQSSPMMGVQYGTPVFMGNQQFQQPVMNVQNNQPPAATMETAAAATAAAVCGHCGADASPGASFCEYCGAKLK